ncbi:MAG: nucleotide sugar dehydrogenase [Pseudomonadota bacterium]
MHYDVAIVGLGYVGLTLATALADVGFKVLGVERDAAVVQAVNDGNPHFSENGLAEMLAHAVEMGRFQALEAFTEDVSADIYVITVGTPLRDGGKARLDFIEAAARAVAWNMPDGALVVLRSTVKIGTARNVVAPILARSGKDFGIAMCPERTLEGRAMNELRRLPQIVGADTPEVRERAAHFFYKLTPTAVQVSSLEAAEIIKLVDNTYRDVQFGFANEVARICDVYGVNAMEVIPGGKLGYERTNVALPGLVGGPCLEKDPHILAQSLREAGVELDITTAARRVNERQPIETVDWILTEHARRAERAPRIALLGVAFKGVPATDDLRGAMSLAVLSALRNRAPKADIRLFDPVCTAQQLQAEAPCCTIAPDLEAAITEADIAIIANNHPVLATWRPRQMQRVMAETGFIYDYWNHFSDLRPYELGPNYFAVGNTGTREPMVRA